MWSSTRDWSLKATGQHKRAKALSFFLLHSAPMLETDFTNTLHFPDQAARSSHSEEVCYSRKTPLPPSIPFQNTTNQSSKMPPSLAKGFYPGPFLDGRRGAQTGHWAGFQPLYILG